MRIEIPTVGAAIIFTVLCMGMVGMFVLLPIAAIHLTWNSVVTYTGFLPVINVWQATLLYLAFAALVYLSGLIRIEFESEHFD